MGDRKVVNIGSFWTRCTKRIFGLSGGYPKGHQAGTVMGMACLGKPKYYQDFLNYLEDKSSLDYDFFKNIASKSEQDTFDVAASLQKATEIRFKNLITPYIEKYDYKNICLSGGVSQSRSHGLSKTWCHKYLADPKVNPASYGMGSA